MSYRPGIRVPDPNIRFHGGLAVRAFSAPTRDTKWWT